MPQCFGSHNKPWLTTIFTIILMKHVAADVLVFSASSRHRIEEEFPDVPARFGALIPSEGIQGMVVYADPPTACQELAPAPNLTNYNGYWIALIARYNCSFEIKVRMAQQAGYDAAIIHNVNSNELEPMSAKDPTGIRIPTVFHRPERPAATNLLGFYVRIDHMGFPVVLALCDGESEQLVIDIFNKIFELAPQSRNNLRLIVCELGNYVIRAVRRCLPMARIQGSIVNAAKIFKERWVATRPIVPENYETRAQKFLEMSWAIPTLAPRDIPRAVDEIIRYGSQFPFNISWYSSYLRSLKEIPEYVAAQSTFYPPENFIRSRMASLSHSYKKMKEYIGILARALEKMENEYTIICEDRPDRLMIIKKLTRPHHDSNQNKLATQLRNLERGNCTMLQFLESAFTTYQLESIRQLVDNIGVIPSVDYEWQGLPDTNAWQGRVADGNPQQNVDEPQGNADEPDGEPQGDAHDPGDPHGDAMALDPQEQVEGEDIIMILDGEEVRVRAVPGFLADVPVAPIEDNEPDETVLGDTDESTPRCSVCMQNRACQMYLPCHHLKTCTQCVKRLRRDAVAQYQWGRAVGRAEQYRPRCVIHCPTIPTGIVLIVFDRFNGDLEPQNVVGVPNPDDIRAIEGCSFRCSRCKVNCPRWVFLYCGHFCLCLSCFDWTKSMRRNQDIECWVCGMHAVTAVRPYYN